MYLQMLLPGHSSKHMPIVSAPKAGTGLAAGFRKVVQSLRAWFGALGASATRTRDKNDHAVRSGGTFLLPEDNAQRFNALGIPTTFGEAQAKGIVYLKGVHAQQPVAAIRLLRNWAPSAGLSRAQVECVHELLRLDLVDFWATMADATAPCKLRARLRRLAQTAKGSL